MKTEKTWNPLNENTLLQPLNCKNKTMFVLNDLFSVNLFSQIDKVMAVIALCPQHTFQLTTKDAKKMKEYFTDNGETEIAIKRETYYIGKGTDKVTMPLPNLWLGVQIENQEQADVQIPFLLETPAVQRFVLCEPLLGKIDFTNLFMKFSGSTETPDENWINWVIVGGANGKNAKPMHPDWVRSIKNQCKAANVPFYFKGWGFWICPSQMTAELFDKLWRSRRGIGNENIPVGFKANKLECLLDGVEYKELPK